MSAQDILFHISVAGMLIALFVCLIIILMPIQLRRRQLMRLWYFFLVNLSIFAFYAEPSPSDDLYRHFESIDKIRNGIINTPLFSWNFLCWVVSLTKHNSFISSISVILYGVLLGSVFSDYMKKHSFAVRGMVLAFLAAFSFCNVYRIIDGIRYVLIVVVWMWAYHFFYEKKKCLYYVFMFLAAGVHLMTIFFVGYTILYEHLLKKKKNLFMKIFLIVLIIVAVLSQGELIEKVLSGIPGNYVQLVLRKWNMYVINNNRSFFTIENIFKLFGMVLLLAMMLRQYWHEKKEISIEFGLMFLTLATFSSAIFFDRLSYAIGLLSFDLINSTYRSLGGARKIFFIMLCVMVFGINIFMGFYAMFSHISFNGIFYHDLWVRFLPWKT